MNFKKKLFKTINSKKYKNVTQHDLNIFIRKCREIVKIRKHIYFDDKNQILFIKSFFKNVSTKNFKKNIKKSSILFSFFENNLLIFYKNHSILNIYNY